MSENLIYHPREKIIAAGYSPTGDTFPSQRGVSFACHTGIPRRLNIAASQITAFRISENDEWECFFIPNADKNLPYLNEPIFPVTPLTKTLCQKD